MRGKKSIDQLREEHETAVRIYQQHPSPFLFEKAREAKKKLDAASTGAAKKKQQEFNQPTLLYWKRQNKKKLPPPYRVKNMQ